MGNDGSSITRMLSILEGTKHQEDNRQFPSSSSSREGVWRDLSKKTIEINLAPTDKRLKGGLPCHMVFS